MKGHLFRILFALSILPLTVCIAGDSTQTTLFWVNAGIGPTTSGLSYGLGATYQKANNVLSIRFSYAEEASGSGNTPREYVQELSLLYGINIAAANELTSFAAGLSLVKGRDRGRYLYSSSGFFGTIKYHESLDFQTVGLAMETQLFWRPLSFLGIGIIIHGNVNTKRTFAGGILCLQLISS